ncbi:MAG: hypothetical protein L6Q54_10100 [Leptospiraceae bacterium]|nr:hypothetical protein [Leptospiraceae bacterium]MCK6381579.1 hypothetical protein [Leptospiraceae bacterium]
MKYANSKTKKILWNKHCVYTIFILFCIHPNLYSQSKSPFWDKQSTDIALILPNTQIEICLAKSNFNYTNHPNTVDCKIFDKENFLSTVGELMPLGNEFKEIKFVLKKTNSQNIYIKVKLEEVSYEFLSIIYNKNLNSYFLELKNHENKYYLYSLNPNKIFFPSE